MNRSKREWEERREEGGVEGQEGRRVRKGRRQS